MKYFVLIFQHDIIVFYTTDFFNMRKIFFEHFTKRCWSESILFFGAVPIYKISSKVYLVLIFMKAINAIIPFNKGIYN